ncbi:MAG TPA: type II toxin-antitoxin system RelB/DinJ family antitoxin [Candidatus Dormibacteraeota bacterium]|nr:type II toxin-antitoxin system RelB/DinJ family antitoxin [Candidatus Dormibacteraeota bacterium]
MSQVPMTIKIDADVKQQSQKLARRLGLSLSAIVENKLREVVAERRVVFEEELIPNEKTAKELVKIEADIKAGRNLSKTFTSFEELEKHLNSLGYANSNP